MSNRFNLLKIFEAIENDDHRSARKLLHDNFLSQNKIPIRQLCGLAILAAEQNAINVTNEFRNYNLYANDPILSKYINLASQISDNKKRPHKSIISKMMH